MTTKFKVGDIFRDTRDDMIYILLADGYIMYSEYMNIMGGPDESDSGWPDYFVDVNKYCEYLGNIYDNIQGLVRDLMNL